LIIIPFLELTLATTLVTSSLLSSLHQLKKDNNDLEDRISLLAQRRDQLLAVNARLAISLSSQNILVSSSMTKSSEAPLNMNYHKLTPQPSELSKQSSENISSIGHGILTSSSSIP